MSLLSVVEVKNKGRIIEQVEAMRVIMVRGVGYVLVGDVMPSAETMLNLGFVIAEQIEEGKLK